MEFRYRADRRCDQPSPFVEEPLPPDAHRETCVEGFAAAAAAPTISGRELLIREFDRMAWEAAKRRRVLEDEIRRELAFEREVAVRRYEVEQGIFPSGGTSGMESRNQDRAGVFPPSLDTGYSSSLGVQAHSELSVDKVMLFDREVQIRARMVERRSPLNGFHAGGREMTGLEPSLLREPEARIHGRPLESRARILSQSVERYSAARDRERGYPTSTARISYLARTPLRPGLELEEQLLHQSSKEVDGSTNKRKTTLVLGTTEDQQQEVKKEKKTWVCSLCKVTAPVKEELDRHLQGKKHQSMVIQMAHGKKPLAVKEESVHHNKAEGKKAADSTSVAEETRKKPTSKSREGGKKDLWCKICMIKCNSEIMLASHLGGKKHMLRVQEASQQGTQAISKS